MNEQRFRRLNAQQPEVAEQLWKDATADLQKRYDFLAQLAGKAENRLPKANLLTFFQPIKKPEYEFGLVILPINKTILRNGRQHKNLDDNKRHITGG